MENEKITAYLELNANKEFKGTIYTDITNFHIQTIP